MAIAARAFDERAIDLPRPCVAIRRRSEIVSAMRLTGETSSELGGASSSGCEGSPSTDSALPLARLMIWFEMIPCRHGWHPVASVACPTAVTDSADWYRA